MAAQIRWTGLPEPVRELRFHAERRWRLDFAWPALQLALEVEGGTWSNGRHSRGKGFADDCEKYAELAISGWRLIRVTTHQVETGEALRWIERAIENCCAPKTAGVA